MARYESKDLLGAGQQKGFGQPVTVCTVNGKGHALLGKGGETAMATPCLVAFALCTDISIALRSCRSQQVIVVGYVSQMDGYLKAVCVCVFHHHAEGAPFLPALGLLAVLGGAAPRWQRFIVVILCLAGCSMCCDACAVHTSLALPSLASSAGVWCLVVGVGAAAVLLA